MIGTASNGQDLVIAQVSDGLMQIVINTVFGILDIVFVGSRHSIIDSDVHVMCHGIHQGIHDGRMLGNAIGQ